MHMTFDGSGGISIAASLVGDGLGRPPVLLAHGGGQTRRTWRKTMQQLAQHGYRSLAIDLRGHGESDWPPLVNTALAVSARASQVYSTGWTHRERESMLEGKGGVGR